MTPFALVCNTTSVIDADGQVVGRRRKTFPFPQRDLHVRSMKGETDLQSLASTLNRPQQAYGDAS